MIILPTIVITNFVLGAILTNRQGNIAIIVILGNVKAVNGPDYWWFIYSKAKLFVNYYLKLSLSVSFSLLPPFSFEHSNQAGWKIAYFLLKFNLDIIANCISNIDNISFFEIKIISLHWISIRENLALLVNDDFV